MCVIWYFKESENNILVEYLVFCAIPVILIAWVIHLSSNEICDFIRQLWRKLWLKEI